MPQGVYIHGEDIVSGSVDKTPRAQDGTGEPIGTRSDSEQANRVGDPPAGAAHQPAQNKLYELLPQGRRR